MEAADVAVGGPGERIRDPRLDRLWKLHDFSSGRGLEIGPLARRVVWKDEGDVHYLDVFERSRLKQHYADHEPDVDAIPEIDYVLIDGEADAKSIPEAIGGDAHFDWVIGSHVIEHVPDLVGWLGEVAAITVDGGRLNLIVPDKRYCFDAHRPNTTIGQVLLEHELGATRPTTRAVYDTARSAIFVDSKDAWNGDVPGYAARSAGLDLVNDRLTRSRAGEYIDSHVWVFTPNSFVEQMIELRLLGHSEWKVVEMAPTLPGELEFIAVLERLPRAGWAAADLVDEVDPGLDRPEWMVEPLALHTLAELREQLARVRRRNARLQARNAALKERNARLRTQISALRGSRQWRVGAAVLKPARAIRRPSRQRGGGIREVGREDVTQR